MGAVVRGLIRSDGAVRVAEVRRPEIERPDDVVVDVAYAGVCRTDLYAAEGRLAVREPRVLGHEFAGVVAAAGASAVAAGIAPGRRVAVMPWIGCGDCPSCAAGKETRCPRAAMLGVDRDGAFADAVVVPVRAVFPIADSLGLRTAAFAEPVCAALAVLDAVLSPDVRGERILLEGGNRIAELVRRVIARAGGIDVDVWHPTRDRPPASAAYDQVIETRATGDTLAALLNAVRPGGTLVLKSRPPAPVAIDVALAVRREVSLRPAHYGAFQQAIDWLDDGFEVSDLFADDYPLADFERAFADARSEGRKCFLRVDGSQGRA